MARAKHSLGKAGNPPSDGRRVVRLASSPIPTAQQDPAEGDAPRPPASLRHVVDGRVYARRRLAALAAVLLFASLIVVGIRQLLDAVGVIDDPQERVSRGVTAADQRDGSGGAPSRAGPVPSHRLRVVTHPEGATIELTGDGGSARTGTTPYKGSFKEGDVELSVTLEGYNPLEQQIRLDENRKLELWLDPEGLLHHKLGETTTGSLPKQVAFSPDDEELWVTPLGESGLEVYDAATLDRIAEIDTGGYGTVEIVFTSDGKTVYASQMQTASVFEIDRATHRIRRRLPTGSEWSKVMALSPREESMFVANWSGDNVTEIDLDTGDVLRQLPTVATPRGLYVTPDGGRLFVAGYESGELQRIDLTTGDSDVLLTTEGALRHLVGDPEHGLLYVDDMMTDEIFVIDLATEEARKLADSDHMPNTMDLSPGGNVLYVSNRGENNPKSYGLPGPEWGTVLAIDTGTGEVLDAIVGGNQTTGLDVSADGRLLAFSDFLDNRLSVYRVPDYETLAGGGGGRAEERFEDLEKK
jgi:DNA-binding beta-propeller fold protein YncE